MLIRGHRYLEAQERIRAPEISPLGSTSANRSNSHKLQVPARLLISLEEAQVREVAHYSAMQEAVHPPLHFLAHRHRRVSRRVPSV